MSFPSTVSGTYVNLLIGNGASPEVFAMICGLSTRTFEEKVNTSDVVIRDCASPASIPTRKVNVTSEQWDMTGTGFMNRAQVAVLRAALGQTVNWQMFFDQPTGDIVYGGHYQGPAVLESIKFGATDGDLVSIDISLKSNGAWVFTAS